jgi:hypothetical protein
MARISDLAKIEQPADNNVFPVSDGRVTRRITLSDLKLNIVKQASQTTLGSIKVGSGLAISDTGVLSVRQFSGYVLPPATSETLGGVRIGAGLNISDTSVLSVDYQLPVATNTVLGGVKIGPSISISNGVIDVETSSIAGGNLGDVPYQLSANETTLLPGNIQSVKKYLSQTGTGTVSRAPVWSTLYNFLPITLNSGLVTNINVANGFLPVTNRQGVVTNITLIS